VPFRERATASDEEERASAPAAISEADNMKNNAVKKQKCFENGLSIFTHHIYLD